MVAIAATCTVLGPTLAVLAPPAAAAIGTVIPMNGAQDPIDQIRADDALFAYVTADLVGGRVCVVAPGPGVEDRTCKHPAWGRAQSVSALGSVIIPLERPFLRPGTWVLLGESLGGNVLSNPFTVTACDDTCNPAFGTASVLEWKEAAKGAAEFVQYNNHLCSGLELISAGRTIKSGGNVIANQADWLIKVGRDVPLKSYSYATFRSADIAVESTGVFAFSAITQIPTSVPSLLLGIMRVGTCQAAKMFDRIVADPADPNYREVARPEAWALPETSSPEVNRVMNALAATASVGQAHLHAYERFLGAAGDNSQVYEHLQAAATADFGFELVGHMRDAADALRAYAAVLDGDPVLSTESVTQAEIDGMVRLFTRVSADGFNATELSALQGAGLTDDEIGGVRAQFDPDLIRDAKPGVTGPALLRDAADQYEESAYGFDAFAREAQAVAGATDTPPAAGFGTTVQNLGVDFVSTASTPDGDQPTGFTWDFGDGETAAGSTTSHTYAVAGAYRVSHTVCDVYGCDTAARDVRVGVVGQPPTATFTVDTPRTEGRLLTFDASGSTDPEGSIVRFDWDFGDGHVFPGGGSVVNQSYVDEGTYRVTLTVTDQAGNADTSVMDLTVDNVAPMLTPEFPTRVPAGATRNYITQHSDPGVTDTVAVTFAFGDGSDPVDGTLSNLGRTAQALHSYSRDGTYTVSVTADDGDGGRTVEQVPVLVAAATADAGPDQVVDEGSPVTLGGPRTSPPDPGTHHMWDFGDGATGVGRTPQHTYRDDGTYTATLEVIDDGVPVSAIDTAVVTVRNVAPSLTVLAPSAAFPGENVSLRAFPTDPGADQLTVTWEFPGGATATGAKVDHTFTGGTHTVSVTAADGDGLHTTVEKRIVVAPDPPGDGRRDSRGTDFWLAAMPGLDGEDPQLFISGAPGTGGRVEVPGLDFAHPFQLDADGVARVHLPKQLLTAGFQQPLPYGIHVAADQAVSVYGLDYAPFASDGYLGLPREVLGTDYYAVGYTGFSGGEIGVLATRNDTHVHLAGPNGAVIEATLDAGDVYVLYPGNGDHIASSDRDFTGVHILSDKPVAAYSGAFCANVPVDKAACNQLVEQLTPTSQWGRRFVLGPYATRSNGDRIRVVAGTANTEVRVDGQLAATLAPGEFHEQIVSGGTLIETSEPALVAQFAHSWGWDFTTGDPSMALVVPHEQYQTSYVVATPDDPFESHYINVVTARDQIGAVVLDGQPIASEDFHQIGTSDWAWAQLNVEVGSHRLHAPGPFGLTQYGWGVFDAYSWAGGSQLADVATIARISLDPPQTSATAGQQACLTARVTDNDGRPIRDARVDWTSFGTNPAHGSVVTETDGTASICVLGRDAGTATVTATVAAAVDTAAITWTEPNRAPTATEAAVSTPEDTPVAVTLTGADPDGDPLTFAVSEGPAHGTLTGAAPSLTYTPDPGFSGADAFTFTVTDGRVTSAPATVTLTVGPVNKAPTAQAQTLTTAEDTPLDVTLSATDPDHNRLTFTVTTLPKHGTVTGAAPNLTYQPMADYAGPDSFAFRVCDDGTTNGAPDIRCDTADIIIAVTPVNDAPALSASPPTQVVQYSDPVGAISLSAVDPDSVPRLLTATATWKKAGNATFDATAPLGGLTLAPVSATDATPRTWRLSGQALVGAGTYTVRLAVTDGTDTSRADLTVVVGPEDVTLSYTGDQLVTTDTSGTGAIPARVVVTEAADGSLGSQLSQSRIRFDAYRSADTAMTSPAGTCTAGVAVTGSGAGAAACPISGLVADTYTLKITLLPDSFYTSAMEDVAVTVVAPSTGQTNGGGWLTEPALGTRSNLGFTAKVLKSGKPQGSSVYIYRTKVTQGTVRDTAGASLPAGQYNWIVKSNALTTLSASCRTNSPPCYATFTGKANVTAVNRGSGATYSLGGNFTFQVDATDRGGPPTSTTPDSYAIRVSTAGRIYYQLGSSTKQVLLGGGNIQARS